MWPFRRRQPPEVALTNEAYARWLRACRPPLPWFLSATELEQEQMALIGDQHVETLGAAVGIALAGIGEDSIGIAQEAQLQAATDRAVADITSQSLSMGGRKKRQEAAAQERQQQKDRARSLLGRQPDGVTQ